MRLTTRRVAVIDKANRLSSKRAEKPKSAGRDYRPRSSFPRPLFPATSAPRVLSTRCASKSTDIQRHNDSVPLIERHQGKLVKTGRRSAGVVRDPHSGGMRRTYAGGAVRKIRDGPERPHRSHRIPPAPVCRVGDVYVSSSTLPTGQSLAERVNPRFRCSLYTLQPVRDTPAARFSTKTVQGIEEDTSLQVMWMGVERRQSYAQSAPRVRSRGELCWRRPRKNGRINISSRKARRRRNAALRERRSGVDRSMPIGVK